MVVKSDTFVFIYFIDPQAQQHSSALFSTIRTMVFWKLNLFYHYKY